MKKILICTIIIIITMGFNILAQETKRSVKITNNLSLNSLSGQDESVDNETDENLPPIKSLFADLGYGFIGASGALGFRYSFLGLSIGAAGFNNSVPAHAYGVGGGQVQPAGTEEKIYTTIAVCGDFYFYHKIQSFTIFADLGYFSQSDTVLWRDIKTGDFTFARSQNKDGITFGAGIQFNVAKDINVGVGLHSKFGIYAQIAYLWRKFEGTTVDEK
jgi:hypothetical protein